MEPVTKSSLAGQSKEGATFISHIEDTTGDAKQIPEVVNVQGNPDFIQATTNGAPLNLLSKESLQLYLILLTACLNATASGFDGSIFGSINAMNQYQAYFRKEETGSSTGIIFAIYTIGSMVGAVFTGFVCDVFGRRAGMGIGAVIIMIGAVLVTAAQSEAYLLGGRFVVDSCSDWAYHWGHLLLRHMPLSWHLFNGEEGLRATTTLSSILAQYWRLVSLTLQQRIPRS